MQTAIPIPHEKIAEFCRRWGITEFALFGSVLRDDFRPDSDVDVMVTFRPDVRFGLFQFMEMEEELAAIFGRPVDLAMRSAVEASRNPYRRNHILSTAEVVHVAG